MARRATTLTKGRTAGKKSDPVAISEPVAAKPARRGSKAAPHNEMPIETSVAEAFFAGGNDPAPDAEPVSSTKGRRARKVTSQPAPDVAASESKDIETADAPIEAVPSVEVAPKAAASPRMTRRNREPEASAPPPLEVAEAPSPVEPDTAAAQWHADTGTVTFDWPSIEQVAAAEGPNQPMAKLLLAARAEGATSRWPF